LEIKYLHYTF